MAHGSSPDAFEIRVIAVQCEKHTGRRARLVEFPYDELVDRHSQDIERSVDEYVQIRRRVIEGGEIRSLEEWELGGHTDHFGDIAQRISAYAVRINGQEELAERGVMSFQLVRTRAGWRIHSLTWHAESGDHPVPERLFEPRKPAR